MNASQAGNSLFFGFHANKPVPSFLAEDCPLYDWCRPTDHPKFFAADAFAQKAGERILGDDAMAWCRKEFVNKLKNMVPKPKLINKAADLLDEEAACAIQKHWRNKKDSSSVFGEAESKLTREFGHPEDSLDILIKNTTVSNQKSLAELLLGTTDTEDLRRAEEQIGINNCDEELQFEDAVQMKEHYPNFSRQTSIASSLGQELKAGKENIIGKRNSEVCRSIYSFAGKGKDDQHSSSNMTGSCQKKQKPVNVIKFIPSANNRVSGAMKKSMSQTGIEITMAEQERNPLNDDLVFRAITIEHNRSHLDNSYHSEPSFLEETLIAALEQPLSRVAIEPYSMQKSVEFASFLKERSCPATPERSSLDSHLDLSSEEDKTAMFESVAVEPGEEERCGGYYSKEREPSATVEYHCQDFSIDLPPLETSLAVLSQHTASKPKPERIINKKGKNQEIEIFFSEEQEDPRMEVVTMVEPEFISPRQHFSNDLHAEKKTKAGQETCKSAHVPLLKHSGCKKSKKECLACKQASHADVSKSTKQADKRLGSFGKPSDRKQGLQSGQTSPSCSAKEQSSSKKHPLAGSSQLKSKSRPSTRKSGSGAAQSNEEFLANKENRVMAEEKNSEERGVKPRSQVSPTLIKHKNKPGNSSPRVPLEQNVMDSQLQAQRLHLANEKMAAITQKTHLEAKLAKMKDENCYQTVHFEERPQKTAALAFLSSENKSTMTDLTSAQLDLIMADFANFKKSYQALEKEQPVKSVLALLSLMSK